MSYTNNTYIVYLHSNWANKRSILRKENVQFDRVFVGQERRKVTNLYIQSYKDHLKTTQQNNVVSKNHKYETFFFKAPLIWWDCVAHEKHYLQSNAILAILVKTRQITTWITVMSSTTLVISNPCMNSPFAFRLGIFTSNSSWTNCLQFVPIPSSTTLYISKSQHALPALKSPIRGCVFLSEHPRYKQYHYLEMS